MNKRGKKLVTPRVKKVFTLHEKQPIFLAQKNVLVLLSVTVSTKANIKLINSSISLANVSTFNFQCYLFTTSTQNVPQSYDEAKTVTTAKRACASCSQHGMVTARLTPERTDLVMPL
jgi:hypothetical protein